ncbi:PH domain-containing protein [Ornithinimicrobium pratense]|uniref:PH domain-containing protein n=2 Tax=Ornithinimicrobium pratense TaxID=2593973 RepID=A0A5J6VAR1_9MICO|nr:PH domain-containing protein [Ornithinimicrobium pratense]
MAVLSIIVFVLVAIFAPTYEGVAPIVTVLNRVALVGVGAAMAAFLWRYAVIRAVPTPQGLTVVNLFRTYEVEWAQILGVGFAGGSAWAILELTDTEEIAVMAIQRADGDRAHREASRLAALIQHHQNRVQEQQRPAEGPAPEGRQATDQDDRDTPGGS